MVRRAAHDPGRRPPVRRGGDRAAREELEHGDLPPYDTLRKLFATFGLDAMARERFKVQIEREKAGEAARRSAPEVATPRPWPWAMLPIIELCR